MEPFRFSSVEVDGLTIDVQRTVTVPISPKGVVVVSLEQDTQSSHEVFITVSDIPAEVFKPPDLATSIDEISIGRSVEVDELAIDVHGTVMVPIGPKGVVDVSLIKVQEQGSIKASEYGCMSVLPAFPSAVLC